MLNRRKLLEIFGETIPDIDRSWSESIHTVREINEEQRRMAQSGLRRFTMTGVMLLAPALSLQNGLIAGARDEAMQKCSLAVIAVRRYQLSTGNIPDSLSEISHDLFPASFEPSSLTDPFDGKLLRYLVNNSSLTSYSVGQNEIDDGGQCESTGADRRPLDTGLTYDWPT